MLKNKWNLLVISLLCGILTSCSNTQKDEVQEELLTTDDGKSVYHWDDGMCEYEGIFDSTQISRKQLDNVRSLVYAEGCALIRSKLITEEDYDELIESDIADLKKEYDKLFKMYTRIYP